jgi:membrane protease subunit (stomatin/prohibitin family)
MSLWNKLTGEFIDIIEWTEPAQCDILCYRFPRYNNEIKMGAKLTVREGQNTVFVNEGRIADVFQPGMYTLQTHNMPILSTLMGWKYGFNSPFKAEAYFVSTKRWTDQKWGTQNPIMLRDPEFGPVRVRAFGTYAFHVRDAGTFLKQVVATDQSFETFEIANQMRDTIVARIADVLGQLKMPVLDLAGNYEKAAQMAKQRFASELLELGLELTAFYIENISLPPEVEKALDERSKMGVLGDMNKFTQYQAAQAIRDAAQNPGGVAGVGAGLAAGYGVAQHMAAALGGSAGATATPPPLPAAGYFLGIGGHQQGPFDMGALQAKMREGSLTRATLVWKQGMASWVPAETVAELQSLFAAVPPPLPPG